MRAAAGTVVQTFVSISPGSTFDGVALAYCEATARNHPASIRMKLSRKKKVFSTKREGQKGR